MRSNRTIAGVIDNAATCYICSAQVAIIKVTTVHEDLFSFGVAKIIRTMECAYEGRFYTQDCHMKRHNMT